MQKQRRLGVGPFRLEIAEERLYRGKQEIHLHRKSFAVLRCLAEHAGSLVSRNTLLDNVWAKLHVTDAVLTEAIKEIRKALGDDAKKPLFIETLHGRGYRLIAPVHTGSRPSPKGGRRSSSSSARRARPGVEKISEAASTIGVLPLVGRDSERSFLRDRLNAALRGTGSLVFITGRSGIGKTRLAIEVRHYVRRKGCRWLEGKYDAVSPPYKAWSEIVRTYLQQSDDISLENIPDSYASHLAKFAPDRKMLDNGPARVQGDPETEQYRLFEGLTGFLIHASHTTPLVLFLDDLQWAPSIDLLHYLSQKIGNERILTLAAYRDDELQADPSLWRTVATMNRHRLFYSLALKPLDHKQVGQLLSQHFKGEADPGLAEVVYRRTKGNPFFVEETARFFLDERALVKTQTGWNMRDSAAQGIPESIKAVINDQVARLGDDAAKLLRIASVAGHEFSLTLLQELIDDSEEALIDILDRCEETGLIVSQRALGEELYNFDHDLIQETLYDSIGPARRRRHHLRIGKAIEKLYSQSLDNHYDALAHHFLEANELEKALQYSLKAGTVASESSSWELAAGHFKTVLELLKSFPEDLSREVQILEQITSLETLLGRPGLAYADRALQIYTRLGNHTKAARVHHLFAIGWTSGTAGEVNFPRAQHHRETAVRLFGVQPDSVEKAVALAQLSFGSYYGLNLEQGVKQGRMALSLATRLGNSEAVTEAAEAVASSLMALGQLSKAEQYAEQAWQACRQGSDTRLTARTAIIPIMLAPWRHDKLWLERWVSRSLEYHRPSRVLRYELSLHSLSALLWALSGRPAEAMEALDQAEEAALQRPYFTPFMLRFTGAVYAIIGDWERAEELLSKALMAAEKGGFSVYIVEASAFYADFLLTKGDFRRAEEVLVKAVELAQQGDSVLQELRLLPLHCELLVRTKTPQRLEMAELALKRSRKLLIHKQPWSGLVARVHLAEGKLAVAQKNWLRAEKAFRSASNLEQTYGFPYHEARVFFEWSQLYATRKKPGDDKRSEELVARALKIYQQCGARRDIGRVDTALASL